MELLDNEMALIKRYELIDIHKERLENDQSPSHAKQHGQHYVEVKIIKVNLDEYDQR